MTIRSEQIERESWHLDKKVPISLIATLVLQAILTTWYISGAYNELKVVRDDMVKIESKIKEAESKDYRTVERLASLEEQTRQTNKLLEKIWFKMENSTNGSRTNGQITIP